MSDNSRAMDNGIKLEDGRIIVAYPKQNEKIEESANISCLDKTGEYYSVRKKPKKSESLFDDELALRKMFTDNAFLILANRKRILSDSRMFLTPVPVRNGLAYSGAFQTATLGVYVEWWLNCPYSVLFDENDTMSLIWFLSGSPLSGGNCCSKVGEDGRIEEDRVNFFIKLWPKFANILDGYSKAKLLYQAYSLPEVIDILKKETTTEYYQESISAFHRQAKVSLLNAELQDWIQRFKRVENERNDYQKKYHLALISSRMERVKEFYNTYIVKNAEIEKRKVELEEDNRRLKAKLRNGELTNKQFQPLYSKNKKAIQAMEYELAGSKREGLVSLFPEMVNNRNSVPVIDYSEDNIFYEIMDCLKRTEDAES